MFDAWWPHVLGAVALLSLIGPLVYYAIWYRRVMSGARRDLENMRNDHAD